MGTVGNSKAADDFLAEAKKSDLRKAWSGTKKQLPKLPKLSPEGIKKVKGNIKNFEKGIGKLLDQHHSEIEKLPRSRDKVKDVYAKIEDLMEKNRVKLVDDLKLADRKIVENYYNGDRMILRSCLKSQKRFFKTALTKKAFLENQQSKQEEIKNLGTEEQAKKLIEDLKQTLAHMVKQFNSTKEKLDSLEDKFSEKDEKTRAFEAQGSSMRAAAKADAQAILPAAEMAKRAAPLFRERLNKPRQAVERRRDTLQKFFDKEKSSWSKKRGCKLGSYYDMKEALDAANNFIGMTGSDNQALYEFIKNERQRKRLAQLVLRAFK